MNILILLSHINEKNIKASENSVTFFWDTHPPLDDIELGHGIYSCLSPFHTNATIQIVGDWPISFEVKVDNSRQKTDDER